ncbi:hypothetical protein PRIPAC_79656, partial [Pristionchus pacificus]
RKNEMISCDICDVEFEHRLELVEHQSSLSHQIRVGISVQKGAKRECPVCNYSCADLSEYSKHVDGDSHLTKLRALRSRRIAMVDSNIPCMPFKRNSRFDSPAYFPPNMQQPPPPLPPSLHWPPPPIQPIQQVQPSHFNSFRPSLHNTRLAPNHRNGDGPSTTSIHSHQQHHQQNGPSNRKSIYSKDNRKTGQLNNRKGASPKGKKEEVKKKKGGVISKVLSSAAIVKKKKEIVTTPKVTSMENKNKRYESLALKGAGMVMASNKSRTQVMMMERQVKYSLVERRAIEDTRGNGTLSSIPSITAPPPIPFSPPPNLNQLNHLNPRPSFSSPNVSLAPSSISDSTYAFCHPVHSTPHQLHASNWPEFVRGMNALDGDTPSTSTIFPSNNTQSESYVINGKGMNTIKIKEELKDDDEEMSIIPLNRPIKVEPSTSDQSSSADYRKILENKNKFEKEKEEHNRKLSLLSARREESRRRFDEEMRQIDEEERIENEKMSVLASAHTAFQTGLRKLMESHGL